MKQAIILAAGEGQRLKPFTLNRPKVMLSIANKPILQYVVEALAQNGIRDIVLVVGYRQEQVYDYMGSGEQLGVNITYVTQARQLGTADALAQTKDVAEAEFLVLPGDNLIEAETIAQFSSVPPEAVLVKRVETPLRYGVVTVEDGLVTEIVEKPERAISNIVSTGIYAFTREVFEFIGPELDLPDILNKMLAQGHHFRAEETEGTWLDAIYPWDILGLNAAALSRLQPSLGGTIESGVSLQGRIASGKGCLLRSHSYLAGPVIIGEGCHIGPSACILPATSIGNNVVIGPFTEIKNSVIGDDVTIGPGCIIEDSMIDRGCSIKGRFTACSGQAEMRVNGDYQMVRVGAMLGEGCNIGSSVVAQPGVIVGNYSQIQSLKLINGTLPDRSMVI